ncbi:MAG: hypothetical protein LBO00_10195 [Zoogloeaceae bacterium]|jgi:hypothetical protein|nr:hypothetical protein [Zoogloeaceae bacterium]
MRREARSFSGFFFLLEFRPVVTMRVLTFITQLLCALFLSFQREITPTDCVKSM